MSIDKIFSTVLYSKIEVGSSWKTHQTSRPLFSMIPLADKVIIITLSSVFLSAKSKPSLDKLPVRAYNY